MSVFVTGGTGFVGTHLVAALRARGAEVTCLVRAPSAAAALGATSRTPRPGSSGGSR